MHTLCLLYLHSDVRASRLDTTASVCAGNVSACEHRCGDCLDQESMDSWVHSISWLPDGKTLAAAVHDCSVRFWRPFDRALLAAESLHALPCM